MKRYIRSSSSAYTSLEQARHIIDSIDMTKSRRESLHNIQEWNVSPEDAAILIGEKVNGMITFKNSRDRVISVSYGPEDPKADKTFLLEYENGSKRLYGWEDHISSYDGSLQHYLYYLKRG